MMKATIKQTTRKKAIALTAALCLALALTGCENPVQSITNGIKDGVSGENSGSGKLRTIGSKTFSIDEFEEIKIETNTAAVSITETTGSELKAEFEVDEAIEHEFTFEGEVKGGVLQIKAKENGKIGLSFNKGTGQRKLTIELPQKTLKRFHLENELGDITAQGVHADQLRVSTQLGNIQLEQSSGDLDLSTQAGDIELTLSELKDNMNLNTELGNVSVELSEKPASLKLNLKTELGKVSESLSDVDYSKKNRAEVIGTIGDGSPKLDAASQMGDIEVNVK